MTRETRDFKRKPKSGPSQTKSHFSGKKSCPFSGPDAIAIDYKDARTLSRFVTERGKIMPRRITYVTPKAQRGLSIAIKRARYIALMPYVSK
ncbi:MAG: 30S ribosomal protein S18 [Alphaproteobacteria bacterium RIFCSPLOWO2_01_FULL_45_8]|nr:MAG: 30S ribosomal protein S18 [Alphaproteobacteria bacterium GWB1_45_5]OFW75846.1 MAG: 30S ribosomal protein S18 [Alphaproteobacteria bacterium GWA1_45_9]OFW89934.1 MAG: 30S ribosomal protein S18 [Alphaproteobacteria bacterium RIFCSPHIGHO2_01_FULL_41_14]OFW96623.1 MAG: 30S ribosomal protein S18 [Alphaproteobacteria bacterium RIFCSPLOWO2_01_FULL_45_8]HCI48374.1 30S ribosomal protein S18 [Holosporales bacterium]